MSCRGWSSDAYWAARASAELGRLGHHVTLVCRRGTEARVMERARDAGAEHLESLTFEGGVRASAVADLRALLRWLPDTDVVHVHRGKEHWLAALANRITRTPRPLVRTRHIVQPIRAHALNRWLYQRATDHVVSVSAAIGRQMVAAGLVSEERVTALPGGVDAARFHPAVDGSAVRQSLGIAADVPLAGVVSGLRAMKGHLTCVEAARQLAVAGHRFHMLFIGRGSMEGAVRQAITAAGLWERVSLAGFVDEVPAAIAALDVALYVPLESDGMSRILFEYLAVGRPVVASRVGVVPELIEDGQTALTVPAGEPEALSQAVAKLLEDPGLRSRLGHAGRRLVEERVSGTRVAQGLCDIYGQLAGAVTRQ
jgi:glycosyltransferase involved in cell wall biosynthesis